MYSIEIKKLSNNAHRKQIVDINNLIDLEEGWAILPDNLICENFPFGDVEIENINNLPTVIKWTPLTKLEHKKEKQSQLREEIYNTEKNIEWEKSMITVTEASQKWLYYTAEGDSEKADELQKLIKKTKQEIRKKYPN